jgi:hypothetical protein
MVVLRQFSENGQQISGRHRRNNLIDAEIIMKETAKVDAVAIASAINIVVDAGNFVVTATIDGQMVNTTVTNAVSAASKTVTIVTSVVVPKVTTGVTSTLIAATTSVAPLTSAVDGPFEDDGGKSSQAKLTGAWVGASVLLLTVVGVGLALFQLKRTKTPPSLLHDPLDNKNVLVLELESSGTPKRKLSSVV